jgi:hypothetical protein
LSCLNNCHKIKVVLTTYARGGSKKIPLALKIGHFRTFSMPFRHISRNLFLKNF